MCVCPILLVSEDKEKIKRVCIIVCVPWQLLPLCMRGVVRLWYVELLEWQNYRDHWERQYEWTYAHIQ